MSREVIWTALGLFALNLGALIGWTLAYRPRLVLTSTPGDEASPMREFARRLARRVRPTSSGSAGPAATMAAPPTVTPPLDQPTADAQPAANDALERWITEMDAGDRAEATTHEDDPDGWWEAWAETHGGRAPADGGNASPPAARSGRPRRPQRQHDVRSTA